MEFRQVITQLRDILVKLYSLPADIARIADDAGLPTGQIQWQGSVVNVWHTLLQEAAKNEQIPDLLKVVQTQYDRNRELAVIVTAYQTLSTSDMQKFDTILLHEESEKNVDATITESRPVPVCWLDLRMLRRWLWQKRERLHKSTRTQFTVMIQERQIEHDPELAFSMVMTLILFNTPYLDIISCLHDDDLIDFVRDSIEFWTKLENNPDWLPNVSPLIFPHHILSAQQIRYRLAEYFKLSSNLPRSSIKMTIDSIAEAAQLISNYQPLANLYISTLQSDDARQKRDQACNTIVNEVEDLVKKMLQFCVQLHQFYSLPISLSKSAEWDDKELDLHNAAATLMAYLDPATYETLSYEELILRIKSNNSGTTMNARQTRSQNQDETVEHLRLTILPFIEVFYGAKETSDNKEKRQTAVKSWGHSGDGKRNEAGEHEVTPVTTPKEAIEGPLMILFQKLRQYQTIFAGKAEKRGSEANRSFVYNRAVAELQKAALDLETIFNDSKYSFPEIVRVSSISYGLNELSLKIQTRNDSKIHEVRYTDTKIMMALSSNVRTQLIDLQPDQDYWIFPAPVASQPFLLNPLLLPMGNSEQYNLRLELKVRTDETPIEQLPNEDLSSEVDTTNATLPKAVEDLKSSQAETEGDL